MKTATKKTAPKQTKEAKPKPEIWELRLYVAGNKAKSIRAIANLKLLCEEQLKGRYRIEVIDLLEHPQLASGEQIVAVPTLIRKLPMPLRTVIGDLSNTLQVLVGLDLKQTD